MLKKLIFIFCSLLLVSCAHHAKPVQHPPSLNTNLNTNGYRMTTAVYSQLQHGKRFFEDGYYKKAMRQLLPLACDGNPEAQYAVGYMYYYGNGVAQDTEVGYFWIQRSADQGFAPAIKAMAQIQKGCAPNTCLLGMKKL